MVIQKVNPQNSTVHQMRKIRMETGSGEKMTNKKDLKNLYVQITSALTITTS